MGTASGRGATGGRVEHRRPAPRFARKRCGSSYRERQSASTFAQSDPSLTLSLARRGDVLFSVALVLQLNPFSRSLTSERQQDVGHLLAIARLLEVEDLAAAAIGDACLRNLRGIDGVVALDVLGPHDTGDDQFADFEVDADLLLALDHEIAVRQHL